MKRHILISLVILLSIIETSALSADIRVPDRNYPTIQSGIDAAVNGDTVVVEPGIYTGPGNVDLDFKGKAITLTSWINPAYPNWDVVADTVIDCGGSRYTPHRAFYFHGHEGANSKVLGFTIRNGYFVDPNAIGENGDYGAYPPVPYESIEIDPNGIPRAERGQESPFGYGYGGGILCENSSSPTIQYCVITNCTVTGGQGGDGAAGQWGTWSYQPPDPLDITSPDPNVDPADVGDGQWGGHGGDGWGIGYGGCIACLDSSSPFISDCIIKDNIARGGCGGNGGNGGYAAGTPPAYNQGNESFGGEAGISYGDGIGGGIYCENKSSPTIVNCEFINNIATTGARAAGGLRGQGNSMSAPTGPAQDGNDSFVYSFGGVAGGAAYYSFLSNADFNNCTFTNNKAYEAYVFFSPLFGLEEDISAYTIGGALYSDIGRTVTLNTCDFINNAGGAVYCNSNCTVDINNCSFKANSDLSDGDDLQYDTGRDFGSGGAIYIGSGGTAKIQNCFFSGNLTKNDGGALKSKSNVTLNNCSFGNNTAENGWGGAADLYTSSTKLTIDVNNCSFSGNQAPLGGGFSSDNFQKATFTDCYFFGNTAEEGGGLHLVNGDVTIDGGIVKSNTATDGYGGGLHCRSTKANIQHCTFIDNLAYGVFPSGGSGAAIDLEGASTHRVFNCLLTGNSAAVDGGAVYCFQASPEISNCTFDDDFAGGYGGAIFSSWDSLPEITNCIFQNCDSHAIHEEDYGGGANATYCLFYSNPDYDYYESDEPPGYNFDSVADPNGNFNKDPLFVNSYLGGYYLSQSPPQAPPDSPAVDSGLGTALSLGLDTYTTRTDSVGDEPNSLVDRGYHYRLITDVMTYQLTARVVGGHGAVVPTSPEPVDYDPVTDTYTYYVGTVVTLTAAPNAGWLIKAWNGTEGDTSTDVINTVIMNLDKTVTVEFKQERTLIVAVGGGEYGYYSDIQDAVFDANDGDTIVVYAGTYYSGYLGRALVVDRSVLITSRNPDDPCCVAETIIDGYIGTNPWHNNGVTFSSNAGVGAVLNGFTIQNCGGSALNALPGRRDWGHPNGYDGGCLEGPAMFIEPGANPTIKNCVLRDNWILGGNGGDGVIATGSPGNLNAGRGGWGGWARGGAIYCAPDSSATFINCRIIDNTAIGGDGGDGGDGVAEPGGMENYGGNWSRAGSLDSPAWDIDPYSSDRIPIIDGRHLWELWEWDDALYYALYYYYNYWDLDRNSYFGDYRWYSGSGGGAYCDIGSNITFIHCEISGNIAQGGMSGQGGEEFYSRRPIEPLVPYEIPTFGGGVYCAAEATVVFTECTITDNISSPPVFVVPANPSSGLRHRRTPYLGHGGGVCAEDTANIIFTDCQFSENKAPVGGGIHWADANPDINDCNFTSNSAFHGGGLFGEHGPATITNCNITNNEAVSEAMDPDNYEETLGAGGGMHLWAADVNIMNCNISNNQAETSGGGVYLGGENTPLLFNCLITDNSAGRDGGGVSASEYSDVNLVNCTIADNTALEYGGGLYCSYYSYVNIVNGIIWDNLGSIDTQGSQLAIGTGFAYDPGPSTITVSYSDIMGWQDPFDANWVDPNSVFVDINCTLNWDFSSVIDEDPLFIAGYYLSQVAADQPVESNCVDGGGDLSANLGLDTYTTRTDSEPDDGKVDMGYHYRLFSVPQYHLTIEAIGVDIIEPDISDPLYDGFYDWYTTVPLKIGTYDSNYYQIQWEGTDDDSLSGPDNTVTMGSDKTVTVRLVKTKYDLTIMVDGGNGRLFAEWDEVSIEDPCTYPVNFGTVVELTAEPGGGYRVKRWSGTDDDASRDPENKVTMNDNKIVHVEFGPPLSIAVPTDYATIQDAIFAAQEGDTIVVCPGTYYGPGIGLGKSVTIRSEHPDKPSCVAETIIDRTGYANRAFTITNGANGAVLNGLTIQNCRWYVLDGDDGDRTVGHPNGEDGWPAEGSALYIYSGVNCTIKNCTFRDNWIRGGHGGNGVSATDIENASRGGWGAWARGGAIYCGPASAVEFINCNIIDNTAVGGNGGDGGNYQEDGGLANHGGNWSAAGEFNIDPNKLGISTEDWVDGDLWTVWQWDWAPYFWANYGQPERTSYIGDYRWYSGYGGGVYCDVNSAIDFNNCTISGNIAQGGMSGEGGDREGENPEPEFSYEIPSYGGGVYCSAGSSVTFRGCTITDNISSPSGPMYRIDPYIGNGGGVCAENTASVIFTDTTISENEASLGAGAFWSSANPSLIDCNIADNQALIGGGVYFADGSGQIVRSDFKRNDANGPVGLGGGIYCSDADALIIDCDIGHNDANSSGGGVYMSGGVALFKNCLITNNQAGCDGGGISINWYAKPLVTNCSFVSNAAPGTFGEPGNTGFGGGLFCSYESKTEVIDSIFWDNYALRGVEAAVFTGFEFSTGPSILTIAYSDVKGGTAGIYRDTGCTLNYDGATNIDLDPLFANGLLGNYYLSQTDPGQSQNSPCVDAGSDLVGNLDMAVGYLDMSRYTTRTDGELDRGIVDMGYHYTSPLEACGFCNFFDKDPNGNSQGLIDFKDFAMFALQWLKEGCSGGNDWCGGADFTIDTYVDTYDLVYFVKCWLAEDTMGPVPNPSEWETPPFQTSPTSIMMEAREAIDGWGWDVQYWFERMPLGEPNSDWRDSPTWQDTDVTYGIIYSYRVKAKDKLGNETEWSDIEYAGEYDTTHPTPEPYINSIQADSQTQVSMTASPTWDYSGVVEYYFDCGTLGGHDSGWIDVNSYVDANLESDTTYAYRVQARDPYDNNTNWSSWEYVTTLIAPEANKPTPNPMEWDDDLDEYGFDGRPHEYTPTGDWLNYWVIMRADQYTTDDSGSWDFQFDCVHGGDFDTDWIHFDAPPYLYTIRVGQSNQSLCFRVRARDMYGNKTDWSDEDDGWMILLSSP